VNFKFDQKKISLGLELPLMEAFYTIQGEGFHKGSAAYFIRIGGCDVGCHWCDVKESWNPLIHPTTEISKISSDAKQKSDIIVITGGEPLIYNMGPLTNLLINNKMKTHLETSGAYPIYSKANELKIIVYNLDDLKFAEDQSMKVNKNCLLYLQPEWSKRDKIMPIIVDYAMKNPKWRVSLQTHKYLNIP